MADGHQLHPALDDGAAQPVVDGFVRHAQLLGGGDGGQRVVNAEQPRHVHLHVHLVLAGHMESHPQHPLAAQQPVILPGAVVGVGVVDAVAHQPAGVALQQGGGVLVVGVHHAHLAPAEQLAFPAAVLLKALVFTGANVVGVQVGEHAHLVADARHPVHHQPLAGHLHHAGVAARVGQLAQNALQVVAFGGGVVQVIVVVGIVDAVCADHAHLVAAGLQHRLDHVGGGGLALGAGHADHGHLPGGVTEVGGGQHGHGVAGVAGLEDGHLGHGRHDVGGQIVLDDQRPCALGDYIRRKLVAVPLGAHNTDKQTARGHLAGVIVDVGDLGIQAALHQCVGDVLDKMFQKHGPYLTVLQNIRHTRQGK